LTRRVRRTTIPSCVGLPAAARAHPERSQTDSRAWCRRLRAQRPRELSEPLDAARPRRSGRRRGGRGHSAQAPEAQLSSLSRLAAILAAASSAAVILALAELAGFVLYQRLLNGSATALGLFMVVATVIGGYAGWLIGVVVYSAVRAESEEVASSSEPS
jgi:hypothetical protein